MHEWPLLIFTLLTQASVGLTLCAALVAFWLRKETAEQRFFVLCPALLCACVLGGIGLIASFAHLGYPLNAMNALRNIARSWLTREIVFASLFLAVLGLATLQALLIKRIQPLALMVVGMSGVVLVFCMGKIYLSTSVVTWRHANNFVLFYGSVCILGALAALFLIIPRLRNPAQSQASHRLVHVAVGAVIFAVIARLLMQPRYLDFLAAQRVSDVITFPLQPLAAFDALAGMRLVSWSIMIAGAGLLMMLLRQPVGRHGTLTNGWLLSGASLLVLAEIMARFVFYSIH